MRQLVKTANRFDTVWTTLVMAPAMIVMLNAGIALTQGKATPAQFASAASEVAAKFTGQYTPYIEATSAAMLTGVEKMASVAGSCVGHNGGPVYINPAMAGTHGCALTRTLKSTPPVIKPYSAYR